MSLKIVSLNANGLSRGWDTVTGMLKKRNIDILCIQEVHRIKKDVINSWCNYNNFDTFDNCLDQKDSWTDQTEKSLKYYQGTMFVVRQELKSRYTISHQIIVKHRSQRIILKRDMDKLEIWNVYAPPITSRKQTVFYKYILHQD